MSLLAPQQLGQLKDGTILPEWLTALREWSGLPYRWGGRRCRLQVMSIGL